jgi:hypothetical protein
VACNGLEFVFTLQLVKHSGVCVETLAFKKLELMLQLRLVRHSGVCVDTMACTAVSTQIPVPYKSLCLHNPQDVLLASVNTNSSSLTLRLVIYMSVYVDTVACKGLEFVLTLWLVKHPGVCVDTVAC